MWWHDEPSVDGRVGDLFTQLGVHGHVPGPAEPERFVMKVLIVYGSTHGQTAEIAERVATRMRGHGAEVVVSGYPDRMSATEFDAIVIGGRVHGSRYPWSVTRFVRRNVRALGSRPSAFFSVSLLQFARDAAKREGTLSLPGRTMAKLGWTPDKTEVFGGALLWRVQYGLLAPLFRRMWRRTLQPRVEASASKQIFTDWDQVDRFADSFFALAASRARTADENRAAGPRRGSPGASIA